MGRLVHGLAAQRRWAGGQRDGPDTKDLAAAGRRIALAAVVIALFIPLLVPGLAEHKLFAGSGSGDGGGGPVACPSRWSRWAANCPAPRRRERAQLQDQAAPESQYLQVYVLNDLSAATWTLRCSAGEVGAGGKCAQRRG